MCPNVNEVTPCSAAGLLINVKHSIFKKLLYFSMQFLSFIRSAKRQYFSQDVSKAHMLCRSVSGHWNFYFLILIHYPWKWIYGFLLLVCTQEFCSGFWNKVRMGKRKKTIYHSLFCWIYLWSKYISLNFGEVILVGGK